jgi:TRAP-type C4-dicarboxylate transport system permease small subunit
VKDEHKSRVGALEALSSVSFALAGAALVAVTLVQAWQVFARYVLNDSPSWTEPVALLLISVTAMLGAAECVRRETHFGFYTFRDAAPGTLRGSLKALSRSLTCVVGLGLAVAAGVLVLDNWAVPMAGAPLPLGLKYLPFALGGALIALFALERLLHGDPLADAEPAQEA